MNFNTMMKNKYLHYFAVILMIINVLGYVSMGSIECVLLLGGAAYLANHFTKNRTADIFIGLFVANVLFGCGRIKEGMVNPGKKIQAAAADMADTAKVHHDTDMMHKAVKAHSVGEECDKECQKKKKKRLTMIAE